MAYQARAKHVKNYRDVKKYYDFPMEELLGSPEKKASSCSSEFRSLHHDEVSLQNDTVLGKKASSSSF